MVNRELFERTQAPALPAPHRPPSYDAVAWRASATGSYIQEIYRRTNGTLGYRCLAWIADRDAGGNIRQHVWTVFPVSSGLMTDSLIDAKTIASSEAANVGLEFIDNWSAVV